MTDCVRGPMRGGATGTSRDDPLLPVPAAADDLRHRVGLANAPASWAKNSFAARRGGEVRRVDPPDGASGTELVGDDVLERLVPARDVDLVEDVVREAVELGRRRAPPAGSSW